MWGDTLPTAVCNKLHTDRYMCQPNLLLILVRVTGIEPAHTGWKPVMQPLTSYTLKFFHDFLKHPGYILRIIPNMECAIHINWWMILESNQVCREAADLQSAAVASAAHHPLRIVNFYLFHYYRYDCISTPQGD